MLRIQLTDCQINLTRAASCATVTGARKANNYESLAYIKYE